MGKKKRKKYIVKKHKKNIFLDIINGIINTNKKFNLKISQAASKAILKKEVIFILIIFFLAITVRFFYLQEHSKNPLFDTPALDQLNFVEAAESIASGDFNNARILLKAPGYTYFLGFLFFIFKTNYFLIFLVQIIIGAISCVLIYFIAKNLFNPFIGMISGVIASLYWMFIIFDAEFLSVNLLIFLITIIFVLISMIQKKPKIITFFLLGIFLGLFVISRPNILLFVPFVFLWVFFYFFKQTTFLKLILWNFILFLGVFLSVFSTYTAISKNELFKGKGDITSVIGAYGGVNFYIGNNEKADGHTAVVPETGRSDWSGVVIHSTHLAEKELGRKLSPKELSSFWYKKGFEFVKNNPKSAAKLFLKKIYLFFQAYEIGSNIDFHYAKKESSILNKPFYFSFGFIFPLALIGIFLSRKEWKKLLVVYLFVLVYSFSYIMFFVNGRYRIPIVPFIIIFSSVCIAYIIEYLAGKNVYHFFPIALIVLIFIISYTLLTREKSFLKANVGDYAIAVAYEKKGLTDKAILFYEKAIIKNPGYVDAYFNCSNLYLKLGKYDEAIEKSEKGLKINPNYANLRYNLGNIYFTKKMYLDAANEYEKALELNPGYIEVYYNLGVSYHEMGKLDMAITQYQKAIDTYHRLIEIMDIPEQISYDLDDVFYNLGNIYREKGVIESAIKEYKNTINENPGHDMAYANLGAIMGEKKMLDEAIKYYDKALTIRPDNAEYHYNLGIVYYDKGKYLKAIEEWKKTLKIDPEHIRAKQNIVYTKKNN